MMLNLMMMEFLLTLMCNLSLILVPCVKTRLVTSINFLVTHLSMLAPMDWSKTLQMQGLPVSFFEII
jgi:hypothetical protein